MSKAIIKKLERESRQTEDTHLLTCPSLTHTHFVLVDHGYMVVAFIVRIERDGFPLPLAVGAVGLEVVIEARNEGTWCLAQVNRVELDSRLRHDLESP